MNGGGGASLVHLRAVALELALLPRAQRPHRVIDYLAAQVHTHGRQLLQRLLNLPQLLQQHAPLKRQRLPGRGRPRHGRSSQHLPMVAAPGQQQQQQQPGLRTCRAMPTRRRCLALSGMDPAW
jgi:hypothetical protein